MKKLTAGILASLIGLVSANSADASVASTNYVDEGLATKQNVLANDVNVMTSGEGDFVTGISAENGVVTVSYGDQAEVEAATAEKAGVAKLYATTGENEDGAMTQKAITDALVLKQNELNSGEGGNITVQGQEGDNVVTGISAKDGVVTVTTGYFDHTDTKIADEVTADITEGEITADQDSTAVSSYSLIKYVAADGTSSYKWELIDRVYTEQPEQQ